MICISHKNFYSYFLNIFSHKQEETMTNTLTDPRKINCQICVTEVKSQENIGNLYNIQKEKNFELLENHQVLLKSMSQN